MLCQSFVAKSVGTVSSLDVWGWSESDGKNTVLSGKAASLRLISMGLLLTGEKLDVAVAFGQLK